MSEWKATGRVAKLLEAMRADPKRIFVTTEAADVMECHPKAVGKAIQWALKNKALYCKSFGPGIPMMLRGSPFPDGFNAIPSRTPVKSSQTWKEGKEPKVQRGWTTDPDDPRIGKVVPGWTPPKMVCVRGGA